MQLLFQVFDIRYIKSKLLADAPSIKETVNLAQNSKESMDVKSVFFLGLNTSAKGIAMVGGACRRDGFAVNINALWTEENSELNTARVWAHELGHQVNANISHVT